MFLIVKKCYSKNFTFRIDLLNLSSIGNLYTVATVVTATAFGNFLHIIIIYLW